MPRRAFFRTLSGSFSKHQDSGTSGSSSSSEPNDAQALKPRPAVAVETEAAGLGSRRKSFSARPKVDVRERT